MRIRQVLLVHPNRAFRGLIKKFIFSEFSDIEIVETDNSEGAFAELKERHFNIILVTSRLINITLTDFQTAKAQTANNSQTPIIVLTESDGQDKHEETSLKNFEHVVHIRIRPADLINKINMLCNPRDMRRDERYHIPNARVSVNGGGMETDAKLINLSKGGILVELLTYAPELLMKNDISMTLAVSTGLQDFTIPTLSGKLLRLNVTEWHPDNTPVAMRATFIFVNLHEEARNTLDALLDLAKNDQWQTEEYIA